MAICRWTGGVSGDWSVAGNWSGAAVPVNGDGVYFIDNAVSVTAGLDQNLVDLELMYVGPTYTGSIGDTANHLILDDIDDFYYAGTGTEAWIETDDAVDGITKAVVANTGTGANALHFFGKIGDLDILKGRVTLNTGVAAADIDVAYVSSVASDVTLTIATGVTLSVMRQIGGVVTNSSNLSNLTINGGTYNHGTTALANTMGAVNIYGGTVNYYSTGAITTGVVVHAGTFSASGTRGAFTINAIQLWKDGIVNLANGQLNITLTSGITNYSGGRLITDSGARYDEAVITP